MRPIHFEILADDPISIGDFYAKTLGWTVNVWGGGEQQYWLLDTGAGNGINGALMHRHFDQAVINTVEVPDLDAVVDAVKAHGGDLVNEPQEIPGVGRHVYCKDPEGNLFGLMEPATDGAG